MTIAKVPYVFFGSPPVGPIALRVLEQNDYPPAAIVTNTTLTPDEQVEIIEKNNAAFVLVVGYGAILKQKMLDSVAGQVINIHPSLLPLYRGPAPVVQTILDGASETGVSVMEIDRKMDHGPILAQECVPLRGTEPPDELYELLIYKGTRLFLDCIDDYLSGELEPVPQDDLAATITHFIKKEDGLLNLTARADENERKVRAFQGWPGTWILVKGKRLIIHKVHVAGSRLAFDEVQPEGGKQMTLTAYLRGQRLTEQEFYATIR